MDKMIEEIYESIIMEKGYMAKTDREILDRIEELFIEEKTEMEWEKYEKCRDKAFSVASMAGESGFVLGFRYAFTLLMECALN